MSNNSPKDLCFLNLARITYPWISVSQKLASLTERALQSFASPETVAEYFFPHITKDKSEKRDTVKEALNRQEAHRAMAEKRAMEGIMTPEEKTPI